LGHALESCGRYEEAEREYQRAIELGEEMRNTRGVYIAKLMYSETLRRLGRTEEAYAHLKQGLALATERKDWHWIGTGEGQLCRFLIEDGNESEAEQALQQALKTAAEHNQPGSESMIEKFKQAFGREPTSC
ncbi:MAG: tetratricopeptide repeat protein, partial [Planctomycetes bacterium]|nr:tetratricopeptide repeat protein [Planctomycetota bacterium]